jgi:hypothetical protein
VVSVLANRAFREVGQKCPPPYNSHIAWVASTDIAALHGFVGFRDLMDGALGGAEWH